MDWSKFDKKCDVEGINEDIKEMDTGDFEEIPVGRYEVRLDSLEMKPTKEKGLPMMVACFTVIEGEYKKRKIFVNQVIYMGDANDKYRVNTANRFLRGLESGLDISFKGIQAYDNLIQAVEKKCVESEYLIEITEKKGFRNYSIIEKYESPF